MGNKRIKPERLPEKLKQIREHLNLTADDLINKLNCPQIPLYRASISQYESGKREPQLIVLLSYSRLAGVHMEVLVDDELDLQL